LVSGIGFDAVVSCALAGLAARSRIKIVLGVRLHRILFS
jgi:hypothetical protein